MLNIDLDNFDLTLLPAAEDDGFEFKSSLIKHEDLKKKLSQAVSGFANSGGGYFIAGVDDNGNADNGLPLKIGRTDLRDVIDQVINGVEPVPKYDIKLIPDATGRGHIQSNSAVLLVAIYESYIGPHMASDGHYYIRAGAHTVKAKHFIVDAIWAKRHFSKPRIKYLFRLKPSDERILQLGITTLTDTPAIDVSIRIPFLPQMMRASETSFPLNLSIIDSKNSFFFDVVTYYHAQDFFENDVHIEATYHDLSGNSYIYKEKLEITGAIPPITFPDNNPTKILKALKSINNSLIKLTVSREKVAKPRLVLSKPSENIFLELEKLIPELLAGLRNDLCQYPFARELIILSKRMTYNGSKDNPVLEYYFEDYDWLRSKLRILENHALIYEITYNNTPRFVISEDLAAYLTNQGIK